MTEHVSNSKSVLMRKLFTNTSSESFCFYIFFFLQVRTKECLWISTVYCCVYFVFCADLKSPFLSLKFSSSSVVGPVCLRTFFDHGLIDSCEQEVHGRASDLRAVVFVLASCSISCSVRRFFLLLLWNRLRVSVRLRTSSTSQLVFISVTTSTLLKI